MLARAVRRPADLWKFEEPYQDTDGSGDFNYPLSGGGGGAPVPEPFCDYNGNGRWDGIYSSGGIDVQPDTSVHDPIDARAVAIGDGTHTVALVSVVAQGLHEQLPRRGSRAWRPARPTPGTPIAGRTRTW